MIHLLAVTDPATVMVYVNTAMAVVIALIHFFPNLDKLVKKLEKLVRELDSLAKAVKKLWHTITHPIKTRRA